MSGVQKHHGADFVRILRCEQLAMESSHENGGSASASTQESCPGLKQAGQWQQSIAACTLSAEIRGAQGTERSHRLPLPLHCQRFERLSELKMKYYVVPGLGHYRIWASPINCLFFVRTIGLFQT